MLSAQFRSRRNVIDLTLSGVTQDGTSDADSSGRRDQDMFGVGNLAFSGTYIVNITTAPYPTPLQGKPPAGSLIYDPSVSGGISYVG